MLSPQKQTIFKDVVEVLETLGKRDRRHTFMLSRYKKQAEALVQVSPAQGYTLLGIIACLEHDIEGMHTNHKCAIAYRSCYETLSNYSTSLEKSCLWNASFDLALAASDADPADKAALRFAMASLPMSGRFSVAGTLSDRWAKISKGEPDPLAWATDNYPAFCERNCITEEEVQSILNIVEAKLSENTAIMLSYASSFVTDDEGNLYLFYELTLQEAEDTYYYESLIDEAISSSGLSEKVIDKVVFSIIGRQSAEALDIVDSIPFDEEDFVEPQQEKLELARRLVEGVSL